MDPGTRGRGPPSPWKALQEGWRVKTRGTRSPALAAAWGMTIYFPVLVILAGGVRGDDLEGKGDPVSVWEVE